MQRCISCGKCTPACPSARHQGCDPHEIMVIGEGDVSQCIQCGNCSRVCRRSDPFTVMRDLISQQRCRQYDATARHGRYSIADSHHPSAHELPPPWDDDGISVMPGCVTKNLVPFLEYSTAMAIHSTGDRCVELEGEGCCLRDAMYRGLTDHERHDIRRDMVSGAERIVSVCPGCREELVSDAFPVMDLIEYLHSNLDRLPRFERPFPIAVEPGCNASDRKRQMTEIVEALGCKLIGNRTGCCGRDTEISDRLMAERQSECSGAGLIVVACPRCFVGYDSYEGGKPVVHLSELVAMASGDSSTLRYHKTELVMDESIYSPTERTKNLYEDKTRW